MISKRLQNEFYLKELLIIVRANWESFFSNQTLDELINKALSLVNDFQKPSYDLTKRLFLSLISYGLINDYFNTNQSINYDGLSIKFPESARFTLLEEYVHAFKKHLTSLIEKL